MKQSQQALPTTGSVLGCLLLAGNMKHIPHMLSQFALCEFFEGTSVDKETDVGHNPAISKTGDLIEFFKNKIKE